MSLDLCFPGSCGENLPENEAKRGNLEVRCWGRRQGLVTLLVSRCVISKYYIQRGLPQINM